MTISQARISLKTFSSFIYDNNLTFYIFFPYNLTHAGIIFPDITKYSLYFDRCQLTYFSVPTMKLMFSDIVFLINNTKNGYLTLIVKLD
jgi:hypothetical protein